MNVVANTKHKKRVDTLCGKLKKGLLIGKDDFYAIGIKDSSIGNVLVTIRDKRGIDVLAVKRGNSVIGWISAEEIL